MLNAIFLEYCATDSNGDNFSDPVTIYVQNELLLLSTGKQAMGFEKEEVMQIMLGLIVPMLTAEQLVQIANAISNQLGETNGIEK